MANIDVLSALDANPSLVAAARTADIEGASNDISDYHGFGVVVNLGAYTDGTWSFGLEESDDNSTWADSTDVFGNGITDVTEGDQDLKVGYKGNKKYVRLKVTVTGASTGMVFGATNVRGRRTEGL